MASIKEFFKQKHEWSKLKDEILEKYLEPYLEKIKTLNSDIAIIDCFAGKGRFDDGAEGSPLIILRRIANSKAIQLTHAYFIEEKYGKELEENIAFHTGKYTILKENYQANIDNIKKICNNKSIFLYIDPYGIKPLDFNYFIQFKESCYTTIELLLNFNTFGFLREGCRLLKQPPLLEDDSDDILYEEDDTNTIENMNNIANGDYWQSLIRNHYDNYEKMKDFEIAFSQKYKNELKNLFRFVINIPIKNKITNIPKYRIYYGTNSIDGLFLMVDQMNRTWKNILSLTSHGQGELFGEKTKTSISSSLQVFTPVDFKSELNNLFTAKHSVNIRDFYIDVIERTGITYSRSEYRQEIKTLEKEKFIKIRRENEKTATGRPSHALDFEKQDIFIERVN
jgi:three-Cys-motif partner protein